MRPTVFRVVALAALLSPAALLAAPLGSINQIVVFGDSLSDNGNAAIALGGTLPGNYAPNAFTDGPNTTPATSGPFGLWIDQLAPKLGLPDPQPFLAGGTNYAIGSAETGTNGPVNLALELSFFSATHPLGAPSNALYAFWAGSNDIFNGDNPVTAADNIYGNILALAGAGGKNFIWLNLPNLGLTPVAASGGPGAVLAATLASNAFNAEWAVDLSKLQALGINVVGVNVDLLYKQIIANPAAFGFADVTTPAQNKAVDPNTFLFWDDEHPTTAANALVANAALNVLVPEPAAFACVAVGLFSLLIMARRGGKA